MAAHRPFPWTSRVPAGLALATAALISCDHRVEEPVPEVRPREVSVPLAKTQPKPWGKRCVRESPKVPLRKISPSPAPGCPADPTGNPKLRVGKVSFPGAKADIVNVEIAETEKDRERGLMYRTKMADNAGMIFIFEGKSDHNFWMHNTCIPLDMLFIDDDGLIVGIEENTPTLSDDTFSVGCPSKYVLELNAGYSRAHGVAAGQYVALDLP